MKATPVVTVFLRHAGTVALVQRSRKVGTYQGCWSGISGYLEGDPGQHFTVELAEETGLNPGDYTLIRRAAPLIVTDEALGKAWEVHPFLCEVHDPSLIRLDWENVELRWVSPAEIRQFPTVPGLWECYVRVSEIAVTQTIEHAVRCLLDDRTSGARQLALLALDCLAEIGRSSTAATAEVFAGDIAAALKELQEARPSLAVIDTTLELVRGDIPVYADLAVARQGIGELIARHRLELLNAVEQSINHLAGLIPDGARILTHSYSSSIDQALRILQAKGCVLTVTESRPGCEGRHTAARAAEAGLTVRLITDAAVRHTLGSIDCVLLGADAITPDGGIVNKMGSALIAGVARSLGIPVYVLAESRKRIRTSLPPLEEGDAAEIWEAPAPGVVLENVSFEKVLPQDIDRIILEEGILTPEAIAKNPCELSRGPCR